MIHPCWMKAWTLTSRGMWLKCEEFWNQGENSRKLWSAGSATARLGKESQEVSPGREGSLTFSSFSLSRILAWWLLICQSVLPRSHLRHDFRGSEAFMTEVLVALFCLPGDVCAHAGAEWDWVIHMRVEQWVESLAILRSQEVAGKIQISPRS